MKTIWIRLIALVEVAYFADILVFCMMAVCAFPSAPGSMASITAPLGFLALLFWLWVLLRGDKVNEAKATALVRIGCLLTYFIAPLQFISVAPNVRPYKYGYIDIFKDGQLIHNTAISGTLASLHMTATMHAVYPGFIIPVILAWILRRQAKIKDRSASSLRLCRGGKTETEA